MVQPAALVPDAGPTCADALKADAPNRANQIAMAVRLSWAIAYLQHLIDTEVIGPAVIPDVPDLVPASGSSAAGAP